MAIQLGTAGADLIEGSLEADSLNGLGGDDTLIAGRGHDDLDGGDGDDRMEGGIGDDTYFVDSVADLVVELPDEGFWDLVRSTATFTLPANVENLILVGSAAINGTGNDLENRIIGNAGNNRLDGGGGFDLLEGRGGNDTYVVDDDTDRPIEYAGGGTDFVVASVSYYGLAAEVENLRLIGDATHGGGNRSNNHIQGNDLVNVLDGRDGADTLRGFGGDDYLDGGAGADKILGGSGDDFVDGYEGDDSLQAGAGIDVINGGSGADYMAGGLGDDKYMADDLGDRVRERAGEGLDTIFISGPGFFLGRASEVERLEVIGSEAQVTGSDTVNTITGSLHGNDTLRGRGGDDQLFGYGGDDILEGGAGNDRMSGDAGDDTLTGGGGADIFFFNSRPKASWVDTITDFASGQDSFRLVASYFGIAKGELSADAFALGAGASEADDRIIYDQASGSLYSDVDGSGGSSRKLVAILTPGTALSHTDFIGY